jgi:hypothetical protein
MEGSTRVIAAQLQGVKEEYERLKAATDAWSESLLWWLGADDA